MFHDQLPSSSLFQTLFGAVSARIIRFTSSLNTTTSREGQDEEEEDVDAAVKAARNAFPSWSQTSVEERIELLGKIVDGMMERMDLYTGFLTIVTRRYLMFLRPKS